VKKYFLTVLVIVSACTANEAPPKDLIAKDKMILLLTEIHLLEAKINQSRVRPKDCTQYVYDHFEGLIFEDFEVTEDQYKRALSYYLNNPNEMEKIYGPVVDTLLQRERRKGLVNEADED